MLVIELQCALVKAGKVTVLIEVLHHYKSLTNLGTQCSFKTFETFVLVPWSSHAVIFQYQFSTPDADNLFFLNATSESPTSITCGWNPRKAWHVLVGLPCLLFAVKYKVGCKF